MSSQTYRGREEFVPHCSERFERKAWNRLIDYLIKLPPLGDD
jgi:hypothetical protein